MGILNDIKTSFRRGNYLTRLIYINIAVFLTVWIIYAIGYLMKVPDILNHELRFLAIPASLKDLLVKPWTFLTYMFTHKDPLHILFNMLWLYWFGRIFLEYLDQKKLVALYLLGGISGAIVYVISFNIFPVFQTVNPSDAAGVSASLLPAVETSVAIGASASVMAVVIAIAAYVPSYTIQLFLLGRIKIIYIALAIFVLTSLVDFSYNSGGKLAHIGGAIFGYLYILNMKKGRDIGKWINKIIESISTFLKPGKKLRVKYKKPVSDYDFNKAKADRQAKINAILDKISKGGYDSLTKEEKELLFSESQKKTDI